MSTLEERLYDAILNNRSEEALSLLRDNPGLNVNWANENDDQRTALHQAVGVEIVKALLAHPDINVNCRDRKGHTPFFLLCCAKGGVPVVRLLSKDPHVDVTLADDGGCTPLWWASRFGNGNTIKWLIASGRDLEDVKNKKGKYEGSTETSALEIARKHHRSEAVSLLEMFLAKPALTRHEIRMELGMLNELAAEVFALTVFLCDDLLQLKPARAITNNSAVAAATQYFVIAARLPMELQMILCHRAVGSMKQNILLKDSEAAFKSLARTRSQSD